MASGRRIRYHREQIAKSHPIMEPPGRTHRVSRIAANNTRESVESPTDFPAGVRADVYEFYWADLTAGATWESLKAWVGGLLFRPLSRSKRCRLAWALLWAGCVVVAVSALLAVLPSSFWPYVGLPRLANWQWLLAALSLLITAAVHRMGTSTFGRVVRYTRADPDNIAARAAVRDRGLKLLRALHDTPSHNGPRALVTAQRSDGGYVSGRYSFTRIGHLGRSSDGPPPQSPR
jgi:hypothetical protein